MTRPMQPEDRKPLFSVEADEVFEFTDQAENSAAPVGSAKLVRPGGAIYTAVVDQLLEFTDAAENRAVHANGAAVPPTAAKPDPAA